MVIWKKGNLEITHQYWWTL